jgi:LPS O-antigen subunit length determinant protein (WzzB/FepE family)
MKKSSHVYHDEIDLSRLFKTIWNKKIIIILIMLVINLALYSYKQYNVKQDLFEISLNIKESKKDISEKFSFINKVLYDADRIKLREDLAHQIKSINKVNVLNRLMKNLLYYQEFIYVLKNNDTVKEKTSQLSEQDFQKEIYEYTKALTIKKNEDNTYTFKLKWHNVDEGKKILVDILNLGLTNLQKIIFNEIENKIKLEKKVITNQDQKKIEFLREQSKIAKGLGIIEGQVDIIKTEQNSIIVDYSSGAAHYLRGYKAIEMEINLIENRKYKDLTSIRDEMEILRNDLDKNWVHYNIFLAESELLNNSRALSWQASTLLSIVIGLFYAFIVYFCQSRKVTRNKRAN